MSYVIILLVFGISAVSSWSVGRSIRPAEGTGTGSHKGPPWKVGAVGLVFLLILFVALGVFSSYLVVGGRTNMIVSVIIAVIITGITYQSRSDKERIDIGDFFNCFTQGFTWPSALPTLADSLGVKPLGPMITPTPTPAATPAVLNLLVSVKGMVIDLLISLIGLIS